MKKYDSNDLESYEKSNILFPKSTNNEFTRETSSGLNSTGTTRVFVPISSKQNTGDENIK